MENKFEIPEVVPVSVHNIAVNASVAFSTKVNVFAENGDISPMTIEGGYRIMPWGSTNRMPYDILDLIQSDETVSPCITFNSELMYGGGLEYKADDENVIKPKELVEFLRYNSALKQEFLGSCVDMKHWGFCVYVIILNKDGNYITTIERREAINCRFEVADGHGRINHVFYANWHRYGTTGDIEAIPLLDVRHPLADLKNRIEKGATRRKFAILATTPGANHYYYPIPQYGCIFKSKWYAIKQLVAISKEAKLRNSAPLKYHVEIEKNYWQKLAQEQHVTSQEDFATLIANKKAEIIEYLTGAENSGKAFFSGYFVSPDGKECHDIKITKVETGKEGGDWEQDYQEAVNTICFALGVHSNLVGSVPGKAQTNNSGSDKRELYTIAQLRQRAYHDVLFVPHELVCAYNGWEGFHPSVPLLMLTTLDEHQDVKPIEQ